MADETGLEFEPVRPCPDRLIELPAIPTVLEFDAIELLVRVGYSSGFDLVVLPTLGLESEGAENSVGFP